MNLPNALTVLRLCLVPVFVVLLFTDSGDSASARVAAFVVFVAASATDFADGALARRSGQVTTFGKIADPIADKALTGSALIGLSVLGELPWWVTVVILIREIGVTVLRFWVLRYGVMAAGRGGKLKTALQMLAIGMYLLPLSAAWDWWEQAVMLAAVVVTVVTGLEYTRDALRLRRAGIATGAA
jgi:CDP-diacylglycerol--glycerol-3-phosphate 3-phosphatidyltransferase